jgi:protein phosphatase
LSRKLTIQAAGATHPGRRRHANEDSFAVRADLGLFMVADGVATRADGAIASATALDLVAAFFADPTSTWPPDVPGTLGQAPARFMAAVKHANQHIHRLARRAPRGDGMATTFVGALLEEDRVCIVHAGDSRAYRLRAGKLEALTVDHNFASELIARGMPAEIAETRADRHALTRALGLQERIAITTRHEAALPGDLMLLCSDGLSDAVTFGELTAILVEAGDLATTVDRLIGRANENGGPDNVTAVLVQWAR